MPDRFDRATEILLHGVLDRAFPSAVAEAGRKDGAVWRRAFGALTYEPDSPETTTDTVFDLASLTKAIATTTLVMRAVDGGLLALTDPVRKWLPEWRGADRESVTIGHLLSHSSDFPRAAVFRDHVGRIGFRSTTITHRSVRRDRNRLFRPRIHATRLHS
jgi:CubicO group peptidase (beta-lactamase class C family)